MVDFNKYGEPVRDDIPTDSASRVKSYGEKVGDSVYREPEKFVPNMFQERQIEAAKALEAKQKGEQGGLETAWQVFGQGVGLIGDVGTKAVEKVFSIKPLSKMVNFIIESSPILQSSIEVAQDLSNKYDSWANENPRAARNLEGIMELPNAMLTVTGAESVVRGGVGAAKSITGKRAATMAEQQIQDAIKITSPSLSKQEKITAFSRAGQPGGVVESGALKTWNISPTAKAEQIATDAVNYAKVSKYNSPVQNVTKLNGAIKRVSEESVLPLLKKNPAPFNTKTFVNYLNKIEPPILVKADETLMKQYELSKKVMLDLLERYPNNMEGLWNARKEFYDIIENQFGSNFWDKSTNAGLRSALSDVGQATNSYINAQTGGQFSKEMSAISNMYEAKWNIGEQNYKLLGKNFIQRFPTEHPLATMVGKTTLGVGGASATLIALKKLFGIK